MNLELYNEIHLKYNKVSVIINKMFYVGGIIMQITTNISNQNLIISLSGRLDTITSPQLEEEINRNSFDEIETVTLNMRELEYISSAGLRVILMLYKKLTSVGGKLRLVNVNDMIMEIFTMTGMDSFLEIDKA